MTANEVNTRDVSPTILLLTHSRTASHVLARMLSKQPNTVYGADWFTRGRPTRRLVVQAGPIEAQDDTHPKELVRLLNEGYTEFLDFLLDAKRQRKVAFAFAQPHTMLDPVVMADQVYGPSDPSKRAKVGPWMVGSDSPKQSASSTAHTNPTVLPDWVLLRPGTVPILNFHHPMFVCDGFYRALHDLPAVVAQVKVRELARIGGTLRWQRLMYDWYMEHGVPLGIEPIILDADDYLGPERELLMQKLCARVPYLDVDSIIYNWPKATSEEIAGLSEENQQVHKTILASDGVMSGYDTKSRDIESEMSSWTQKYGQEEAEWLKELVSKAMPDYEYLRAVKLRPGEA